MPPTKNSLTIPKSKQAEQQTVNDSRSVVIRHLSNIHDIISEEDIRNVEPNNRQRRRENGRNVQMESPVESNSNDNKYEEVDQIPTSWNLID